MSFHGINYLAVIVAAIAGMAVGAIWYTWLKDKWLKAANLNEAEIKSDPKIYLMTFLCLLVVAYVMAGLIGHLYVPTLWNGIITALFCWVGFLLPPMIVNHRFQQSSWSPKITKCVFCHYRCGRSSYGHNSYSHPLPIALLDKL